MDASVDVKCPKCGHVQTAPLTRSLLNRSLPSFEISSLQCCGAELDVRLVHTAGRALPSAVVVGMESKRAG